MNRPLFAAGPDGLIYRVGYVQQFARPTRVPLDQWLQGVRMTFARSLGLDVALTTEDRGETIIVTVKHAGIPTGKRARGTQAGRKAKDMAARRVERLTPQVS